MLKALILATAVYSLMASANAHSGTNGKWCLNERVAGESANCSFATLTQCEQSKTSHVDTCTRNPHTTTGSAVKR